MAQFVTTHAVRRYQARIENVPAAEAVRRIRAALTGQRIGPRCVLVVSKEGAVVTVEVATDAQAVNAAIKGNWVIYQ